VCFEKEIRVTAVGSFFDLYYVSSEGIAYWMQLDFEIELVIVSIIRAIRILL
jgi:hypothetical protein